jgi:hypothetical protein
VWGKALAATVPQTVKPDETVKPAEPIMNAEPIQSEGSVKRVEPILTAEPVKSDGSLKPAAPVKPAEPQIWDPVPELEQRMAQLRVMHERLRPKLAQADLLKRRLRLPF